MKLFINKIFPAKRFSLILLSLFWFSCQDDTTIKYDEGKAITQQVSNPYIQVVTGFVPFKPDTIAPPSTKKYGISFNVINGINKINAVNVYTTFKNAETGSFSNERLIGTYNVTSDFRTVITDSLTYEQLKEGLTVDGGSLPEDDGDVFLGSGWSFRFEGVRLSAETVSILGAINMVLSKYAGDYKVIESKYIRIDVDYEDWNDNVVFIGHVDEVTLSYNDNWGYFPWPGKSFNFTVDPDTKKITVPILTESGLFSGTDALNCNDNGSSFKKLNEFLGFNACENSNILIEDNENGRHKIKITYGYQGDGGARQMYEVLEKIVIN